MVSEAKLPKAMLGFRFPEKSGERGLLEGVGSWPMVEEAILSEVDKMGDEARGV
jgi:hypothetical protein